MSTNQSVTISTAALREMRDRIDDLQFENKELKREKRGGETAEYRWPPEWRLSGMEAAVLTMLVRHYGHGLVTFEKIFTVMIDHGSKASDDKMAGAVNTLLWRLRSKVPGFKGGLWWEYDGHWRLTTGFVSALKKYRVHEDVNNHIEPSAMKYGK
jgi:hypothetical protein